MVLFLCSTRYTADSREIRMVWLSGSRLECQARLSEGDRRPWQPRNDLLPDADLVSPVAQYTAGTALAHQWTRATPQRGTRRRPAGVPPGFCDAGRLSDGAAQRHAGRVSATEYGGDADL